MIAQSRVQAPVEARVLRWLGRVGGRVVTVVRVVRAVLVRVVDESQARVGAWVRETHRASGGSIS